MAMGVGVDMIERQTTESVVHRLLVARLADLEGSDGCSGPDRSDGPDGSDEAGGAGWSQGVEQLCAGLLQLDPDVERTLATVVRASAVIQELLLEVCAPDPQDRRPILDLLTCLLADLRHDDGASVPTTDCCGSGLLDQGSRT